MKDLIPSAHNPRVVSAILGEGHQPYAPTWEHQDLIPTAHNPRVELE